MTKKPELLLWLSDSRGVYIPRDFAQSFNDLDRAKNVTGVLNEDWRILEEGPEHEFYWETWDDVLSNAVVLDNDGVRYTLHHDGDLWLIPEGMEWSDKVEHFVWPEEDPT